MALGAFHLPHRPAFFEPVRQRLLSSLRIPHSGPADVRGTAAREEEGVVRIIYIDRQDTDRRLSDEGQGVLMDVLKGLGEDDGAVEWRHGLFGQIGVKEQLREVSDVDVSPTMPCQKGEGWAGHFI